MPRIAAVAIAAVLAAACSEEGRARDPAVATFGGEAITAEELRAALDPEALEGLTPGEQLAFRRRVLDGMIEQRLLLQAARARGFTVEAEHVDAALERLRAEYPDDAFARMLGAERLTEPELRARIADSILVQRVLSEEVIARVAATDDEVEAWLAEHGASLERPEEVRAAQIVVKTEEEAKALHAELKKGASFEELAKKHSLSPDGKNGGDLGFFARGEMPPPFDEVCFELRPGQLSDVVASSYGFHVFKLLERRGPSTPEPEGLRKTAEARLRREKEAEARRAFVEGLSAAAKVVVDEAALARQMGKQ